MAIDWVQRVCKWRLVFVGWQLGTRSKEDQVAAAVRDHRELGILLRVEVNALTALMVKKGVFTQEELTAEMQEQAQHLCGMFERRFPGFKARDDGMDINVHIARDTTAGWPP